MGRRKGSLNFATDQLIRAVAPYLANEGATMITALAQVVDDESKPYELRLNAVKMMFSAITGKLKLSEHFKAKLSTLTPSGTVPPIDTEPSKPRPRRRRPIKYENPAYKEPYQC
jgi:hypothetical protein